MAPQTESVPESQHETRDPSWAILESASRARWFRSQKSPRQDQRSSLTAPSLFAQPALILLFVPQYEQARIHSVKDACKVAKSLAIVDCRKTTDQVVHRIPKRIRYGRSERSDAWNLPRVRDRRNQIIVDPASLPTFHVNHCLRQICNEAGVIQT